MMKKSIISLLILLYVFNLQSCEKKEKPTNKENQVKKETDENKDSTVFKSQLRPDENLELGKIYTDTVQFVNFDDNGDDWRFTVKKNQDTISLIYNNDDPQLVRGTDLKIKWKMDSLRPAGDPDQLEFSEYLISLKIIKNPERDFSKLKDQSFVISCGAGCAMTHNVKSIKQIDPLTIKVTFEVEMYGNEEVTETYDASYIFYYDNTDNLKKVIREGETENVLETFYMGGAKQSFEEFGAKLVK